MSIDINTTIEEMVRDLQISYMEAIVKYTEDVDGEIEGVAKLLNRSIKDKIEAEAHDLNIDEKAYQQITFVMYFDDSLK